MKRFRFAIAVSATSLALVVVLGVIAVLTLPFGPLVRSALASTLSTGKVASGPPAFAGQGFALPPELQGLSDLQPSELFTHFVGVQIQLKDKDNQPFTVSVTPGTVTAISANSLTIGANDGTTKTFALSNDTIIPGRSSQSSLSNGAQVVVVTLNGSATAKAVIDYSNGSFGPGGFGPPAWVRSMWLHR